MIRSLPSSGKTKSEVYYLEDLGESFYLNPIKSETPIALILLAFSHLKSAFAYHESKPARFYHYRTRGGVSIPICIEQNGVNTGFLPIESHYPDKSELAQARSFLSDKINSKVVFLSWDKKSTEIDEKMIVVPVWEIL